MQEFGYAAEYALQLMKSDPILVAEIFGFLDGQNKVKEALQEK